MNTFTFCVVVVFVAEFSQQLPVKTSSKNLHHLTENATLLDALNYYKQQLGGDIEGHLDEKTMALIMGPRCQMPDNNTAYLHQRSGSYRWRKKRLTFKLVNSVPNLPYNDVKFVLAKSIKKWTDLIDLEITESKNGKADINVHFSLQDGPGKILGYAYFPEIGSIFFDSQENWRLEDNFRTTFLHEFGHALGLDHSTDNSSIMYPYILANQKITKRDRNRLTDLYGQRVPRNILCNDPSIDAMVSTFDKKIIIKKKQYWIFSENRIVAGPFQVSSLFPVGTGELQIPNSIDAAFSSGDSTYFFKDNVYYQYQNNSLKRNLISTEFEDMPGFMDASFYHHDQHMLYFFKGSHYYVFNNLKPKGKRIVVNGTKISHDWPDLPNDLEAAEIINNNRVIFVKAGKYYVVKLSTKKVEMKKDFKKDFLNCQQ